MRTAIEDLPTPPTGVKYIPLTQGKFAIVDEDDLGFLNQWMWFCARGYAARREKGRNILMHRVINNTPPDFETDHINRNRSDNRKINLRPSTPAQNQHNTEKHKDSTTGFKGVTICRKTGKFRARIAAFGQRVSLGLFHTAGQASSAYQDAAKQLHAEFSRV